MISARRPQGNGYDGTGGAAPRGNSVSGGISGDGGTEEADRSPLSCGRGIMDGLRDTLRNAPGWGEGTGDGSRPGGGEGRQGAGAGGLRARRRRHGRAGRGTGRATRPGGPARLCGSPPRGNRKAPGGRPSLRSGAGEGRPRAKLQRPLRTGIREAPRGFASHRSVGFSVRRGRGAGSDVPGRKAAGFASSSFRTDGRVLDCIRVQCLS